MTVAELSIDVSRVPAYTMVTLSGEIDMSTAAQLRATVARVLTEPPRRLVLDFDGVTFCDSQGLSTLIALNRQAEAAGSVMVLANLGDFLTRLLEISGLRRAFHIEDTPPG